jgi:hypothetical protein
MTSYTVILDACVMYPTPLRSYLMYLSIFKLAWLTHFCPCDLKSYEALFTAKSESSVSPDDPRILNKAADPTM